MKQRAAASIVEFKEMKFAITYMPDKIAFTNYLKDLLQYDTTTLVNTTNRTYKTELFEMTDIAVENLHFPDGGFPSDDIIDKWLHIVRVHIATSPASTLAVHDETGLGRSAVLVGIALIERGMEPRAAIETVRKSRRGAFNHLQLQELIKYRTQYILVEKNSSMIRLTSRPSSPEDSPRQTCSLFHCSSRCWKKSSANSSNTKGTQVRSSKCTQSSTSATPV